MEYITFEQVIMLAQMIVTALDLGVRSLTLVLKIVWKLYSVSSNNKSNTKKK